MHSPVLSTQQALISTEYSSVQGTHQHCAFISTQYSPFLITHQYSVEGAEEGGCARAHGPVSIKTQCTAAFQGEMRQACERDMNMRVMERLPVLSTHQCRSTLQVLISTECPPGCWCVV